MQRENTVSKSQIARNSILISVILVLSKVTGFLRELVIAVIYGATRQSDIFKIATTIPTVLFSCIASAIITTFIPVFADIKQQRETANRFFSSIINIVLLISALLTIISIVFAPLLVKIFASGFQGSEYLYTVKLTRIALPSIMFLGIASLYTGYLQSYNIFLQPAVTDMAASFIIICGMLIFRDYGITPAVIAVLAGAMAQILVQRPFVKGFKYSFLLDFENKYIIQTFMLGIPVFMSNIVGQLSVIMNRTMVSKLEAGSISIIDYSSKISTIINQVFVVSVITVLYPILTEKFLKEDKTEFNDTVAKIINIVFIISLPMISMMIIFSKPAVELLFMHGKFSTAAAVKTIACVKILSLGTVGYGILDTVSKVFFAARKSKIPMYNTFAIALINITLIFTLVPVFGVYGAAAATALSGTIMAVIILVELKSAMKAIKLKRNFFVFIKCTISSILIAAAANFIYLSLINSIKYSENNLAEIIIILGCCMAAFILYVFLLKLLKVKEVDTVLGILYRK